MAWSNHNYDRYNQKWWCKMNEELLEILETLKADFEMLQDGTWDLKYSDGSEIEASLENIEKAINIVKRNI